jgi:hypothetical protein
MEISSDKTSGSVSIDTTTKAEINTTVGNDNASLNAGASVKTGTEISAEGGLKDNNVYVGVDYSDTTEGHMTINANVNKEGFGSNTTVDAYAKTGTEGNANISVGQNGVEASVGGSIGNSVGVDVEQTVNLREASATVGAGVSIGEHFEAGGGGEATFKDGKATIGVSGEVAAIVGLDVDVSVTVDTKQINKDVNTIIDNAPKIANKTHEKANIIANETQEKANRIANKTHEKANIIANETQEKANRIANKTQQVTNTVSNQTQQVTNTVSNQTQQVTNTVSNQTQQVTNQITKVGKDMNKGIKKIFKF